MNITELFAKLSKDEREELFKLHVKEIENTNSESKFLEKATNNFICPHCKSDKIMKNGIAKNKQRFICNNCNKTFGLTTNTIFMYTRKELSMWYKYMDLMFQGLTLQNIATNLEINIKTAFYWRHKILNTLKIIGNDKLKGIIEADETFFPISYKGSKKMPRKAKKRGEKAKKRGLSKEQVCVLCILDRSKNLFNKSICYGKMSTENLEENLINKLLAGSFLVTDKEKSYIKYSKNNNIHLKQIHKNQTQEGKFHIQNINNYHGALKLWIRNFKGVSTKHLDNYLNFFKILKFYKKNIFDVCVNINNFITMKNINEFIVKIS
jgi:transposase-like protein